MLTITRIVFSREEKEREQRALKERERVEKLKKSQEEEQRRKEEEKRRKAEEKAAKQKSTKDTTKGSLSFVYNALFISSRKNQKPCTAFSSVL